MTDDKSPAGRNGFRFHQDFRFRPHLLPGAFEIIDDEDGVHLAGDLERRRIFRADHDHRAEPGDGETGMLELRLERLAQSCAANEVIGRISLRWKMSVLFAIDSGNRTFAELKRRHPNLSDHILAARLRELRREGLIAKDEQAKRRPVYTTTVSGSSLLKIIGTLCAWSEQERGARPVQQIAT